MRELGDRDHARSRLPATAVELNEKAACRAVVVTASPIELAPGGNDSAFIAPPPTSRVHGPDSLDCYWAYSWGRRCNAARTLPGTSSHGKWPAAGTTVNNAVGEMSTLARAA